MNQKLSMLLWVLVLVPSLLCAKSKLAIDTRIYYQNSPYLHRIRQEIHNTKTVPHIGICSDWDEVVALSRTGIGKACRITHAVGLGNMSRLFKMHRNSLLKDGYIYDDNGVKIVGAGSCMRYLGKSIPGFAENHEKLTHALAYAKPIQSTINIYQSLQRLGIPVVIWTNNDQEIWSLKLEDMNRWLAEKNRQPFKVKGAFFAGQQTDDVPEIQYSVIPKPETDYYIKAFMYTKQLIGDVDNYVYIFIDDQAENINGLRACAKEANLPVIAIQLKNNKQLQRDLEWLFDCIFSPTYAIGLFQDEQPIPQFE